MNKNWKKMDDKQFHIIKGLLDMGLTMGQIRTVTGRSYNTVRRVADSADFEAYIASLAALMAQRKDSAAKFAKPSGESVASIVNGQLADFQKTINEQLAPKEDGLRDPELSTALRELSEAMNNLAISWNKLSDKMDEVLETKRPWMFGQKK